MQDYKARRTPIRRPLLRGRFVAAGRFLSAGRNRLFRNRKRADLPKGFRPLASSRPAFDPPPPISPAPESGRGRLRHWPWLRISYGAIVLWLAIGAGVRGWDLLHAPLERVRVSGVTTLTSAQVVQTAQLVAGMRLGDLDPYQIALRLRHDPRVEAADARRVYPNALWIDVRERVPDARVLLADGRAALLDKYNVVIRVEPPRLGDLPLIRGLGAGAAIPGAIFGDAPPGPTSGGTVSAAGSPVAASLTQARIFLTQARNAGLPDLGRGLLDLSDLGNVAVSRLERGGRLIFPLANAESALQAYRKLAESPVAPLLSSAREADLRYVDAPDAGRVFLRP